MSNAIKCIVRQGWTTRDAAGNLIERRDYVYVTNEDGTPHIYASIAEARAEIRANYGRDANRAGILHNHSVDDYTGHVHDGYVYIVREDTDEFAAATADAKAEAAAADMPEPIIYATERTEATEPAPFEAEVQKWDTLLIQIEENELVDTRTGKSYTDGYRYTLYTVSQFGNLFTHYGFSGSGKTIESCKRAADRMLKKYFNRRTADIVATGATLEAMHASATDETVHERFKVWAAGLFTDEQDERAAVEAIAADMLEEYGNAEDATNATAYGVFADMHDGARPNDLEPADMEQMDRLMTYAAEAIASIQQTSEQAAYEARNAATVNAGKATKELESLTVCLGDGDAEEAETCANWCETAAEAAEDAARIAAEHARNAGTEAAQEAAETAAEHACRARRLSSIARDAIRYQWTAEETRENVAYYAAIRTAIAATRAFLAAYADAIGETVNDDDPEARAAYHVARDEMTSTSIRATADDRETVAAMVERIAQAVRDDMPTGPENYRPTYQRAELLAYLGEPDDYDVTAIEHDATAYDAETGRTVWAVDAETLAAIAERHQIAEYMPA